MYFIIDLSSISKSYFQEIQHSNKKGDIIYYVCSEKKNSGCKGKATVQIDIQDEGGEIITEAKLIAVSTPHVSFRQIC